MNQKPYKYEQLVKTFVDSLPADVFKNSTEEYNLRSSITQQLEERKEQFRAVENSTYEANCQARREERDKLARERLNGTRALIDSGYIKKGSFIKVTGARDGKGIREVVEIRDHELVCRQWREVSSEKCEANPDSCRSLGFIKLDGMWIKPEPYMTTHGYDKVVKVLS